MFIIDGYNLLRSIQDISDDSDAVSDLMLCHVVSRYLKRIGDKGEMVFDGIGPPDKSPFDNIEALEVFFAGLVTDADSVIEDKIRTNTSPKRLTVVSSDRRLRKAARARRAIALKSEDFWPTVQTRLASKRRKPEPPEKRMGLSESETQQWLEFFNADQ